MAQTIEGARKIAAIKAGVSYEEYESRVSNGEKWCYRCKTFHFKKVFGIDRTRYDGLSSACLDSKRAKVKKNRSKFHKHGWLKPTRDNDKLQARRRINYLVESGSIPHPETLPCLDCWDAIWANSYRHEYDHARGYVGENQLYVEVVCSRCHGIRERVRRDYARAQDSLDSSYMESDRGMPGCQPGM